MRCVLVDTDAGWLAATREAIGSRIDLELCRDFQSARGHILKTPPDVLATNLRLGPYNGLHLVHLAVPPTRCIVFSDRADAILVREAQRAGAFHEDTSRVAHALRSFGRGVLPEQDRRSLELDRRQLRRGGRRSADFGQRPGPATGSAAYLNH